MKYMVKILLGLFIAVANIFSGYAQRDCKATLLNAVAKMKATQSDKLQMQYSVVTNFNADEDGAAREADRVDAIVTVSGRKSMFQSGDMEMYRDDSLQIAVMKDEKKIVVMKSTPDEFKNVQKMAISMLQDSLLQWVEVSSCTVIKDEKNPGVTLKRIQTKLPASRFSADAGIDQVVYWLDKNDGRVVRIQIRYTSHPFDVSEVDLRVAKFDTQFKGEAFQGDADKLVFSSGNKLLPKYKGYTVVDFRKKRV